LKRPCFRARIGDLMIAILLAGLLLTAVAGTIRHPASPEEMERPLVAFFIVAIALLPRRIIFSLRRAWLRRLAIRDAPPPRPRVLKLPDHSDLLASHWYSRDPRSTRT
jgi:hypothetical protein